MDEGISARLDRNVVDIGLLSPFEKLSVASEAVPEDLLSLWRFCSFYGVRPAFVQAVGLKGISSAQTSNIPTEPATFMRAHAFYVLQKLSEIAMLSRAFCSENISAVFFKGAMLGEQIYSGAHCREFNDVDLLVDPVKQHKAEELLAALGYSPVVADVKFRRAFFDHQGQHMFRNKSTGTVVDLHWSFAGQLHFPVSPSEVLYNRETRLIGDTMVPVPCAEDLALILAGHGQKEGWASFGWALDFAQFAAKFPDFDWSHAVERAYGNGSLRAVLTAAVIVEALFGHEIDKGLVEKARAQGRIVEDVKRIVSGYHALASRKLEDDLMGSFRLTETPQQRLKAALSLLLRPTIGDYEALPLRRTWWWLYRFTRPFRLVWQTTLGKHPTTSVFFEQQKGT